MKKRDFLILGIIIVAAIVLGALCGMAGIEPGCMKKILKYLLFVLTFCVVFLSVLKSISIG